MAALNVSEYQRKSAEMTNTVNSDADSISRSVAKELNMRGIVKGDVVLIMGTDLRKNLLLTLGVWRCGGVQLSTSLPDEDTKAILSRLVDGNVRFILCDRDKVPKTRKAVAKYVSPVQILVFNETGLKKNADKTIFGNEDDHVMRDTDSTSKKPVQTKYLQHGGLHRMPSMHTAGQFGWADWIQVGIAAAGA